MSDVAQPPRLVPYYTDYAPRRFRTAAGEPVKRRAQQVLAKKLNIPLIRAGNSVLVDEVRADAVLAALAAQPKPPAEPPPRRRPGRPPGKRQP